MPRDGVTYNITIIYNREQIEKLFIFIDSLLELPKEETLKFHEEIKILSKEGDNMGLSWENTNTAKVFKEIYREEGKAEGKAETLLKLMRKKFNLIPKRYEDKQKNFRFMKSEFFYALSALAEI